MLKIDTFWRGCSKCKEDDFFIRLKAKSVYASTEDIVKYICQKYSLTEEKYDSLAYSSSGGMVLRIANNSYDISVETLANALEDCNYTKGDKLVEALLMAKILAEKIGGKAILEWI